MTTLHRKRALERELARGPTPAAGALRLQDGDRVAVIGGGPAGSFYAYFFLDMAQMVELNVQVDVYEPRDYTRPGPASCNTCGGIVSESLVQLLATEGINLPDSVVQRGLDSYVLHTAGGSPVRIDTPLREKRIAAVHRGAGPRGVKNPKWRSFDGYLQELAVQKGSRVVRKRVDGVAWQDGRLQVRTKDGSSETYDLLVVAVGVNSGALKLFGELGLEYRPPRTSKTYISEFFLSQETVARYLGDSMHVFLLDLPRLEFSALIPKGDYVTLCLLGENIDTALVRSFLDSPEVRRCFPPDWQQPEDFCHCSPRINTQGAFQPFADRIVFIGDCGFTRLYKDGIGAAYRTAKAAAVTTVMQGIAAEAFRHHYWPICQALDKDNRLGELVFRFTRMIKKMGFARRGVVRMVSAEQRSTNARPPRMSMVLWDMFTGSAPYRDIFLRTLKPQFVARLAWSGAASIFSRAATERGSKT